MKEGIIIPPIIAIRTKLVVIFIFSMAFIPINVIPQ